MVWFFFGGLVCVSKWCDVGISGMCNLVKWSVSEMMDCFFGRVSE